MTQTKQAPPDWIRALAASAPEPAKETQLNVRISEDLNTQLQTLANRRNMKQAALVRMLLTAGAHALAKQTPARKRRAAAGGE